MAAIDAAHDRMLDAVYGRWADRATWSGVDGEVRVIFRNADGEGDIGRHSVALVETILLRVRSGEVANPVRGDVVQILDEETGAVTDALRITADPRRWGRRGREWQCEVERIDG